MKTAAVVLCLALGGCASVDDEYRLSESDRARCEQQGGCYFVTKAKLMELLQRMYVQGTGECRKPDET